MLRRISLQNVRGFASLELPIEAATTLVGPNSSGKSTVLYALRLALDCFALALEAVSVRFDAKGPEVSFRKLPISSPSALCGLPEWSQLFHGGHPSPGATLSVRLDFDAADPVEALHVELVYARNAQLEAHGALRSKAVARALRGLTPRARGASQRAREAVAQVLPRVLLLPAFYGVAALEEPRTRPLVRRLLAGGDQSHVVRNLVARLDGAAIDQLNTVLRSTVGAVIEGRTSLQDAERVEHLRVTFRDRNGELELASAGTGLVSLVALFAALRDLRAAEPSDDARSLLVLLDEPEAHLHPRLQGDVAEALAQVASEFGGQLLIATHSVEMINRLWTRCGATIYALDRERSTALALQQHDQLVEGLATFCDLTPFTAINAIARRRVLFVEGRSDYEQLEGYARVLYRNDPARLAAWKDFVCIELNGVSNAPSVELLERVLSPRLFQFGRATDVVARVGVAIDAEALREPRAPEVRAKGPVEYVRAVWSAHSIESLLLLDEAALAHWIAAHLDEPEAAVAAWVAEALHAAAASEALRDAAIDARRPLYRRRDAEGKAYTDDEATKRARADVRADKLRFVPSHELERAVLGGVREQLDVKRKRAALPATIARLVATAPHNRVNSAQVPTELRAFLDALTQALPPAVR